MLPRAFFVGLLQEKKCILTDQRLAQGVFWVPEVIEGRLNDVLGPRFDLWCRKTKKLGLCLGHIPGQLTLLCQFLPLLLLSPELGIGDLLCEDVFGSGDVRMISRARLTCRGFWRGCDFFWTQVLFSLSSFHLNPVSTKRNFLFGASANKPPIVCSCRRSRNWSPSSPSGSSVSLLQPCFLFLGPCLCRLREACTEVGRSSRKPESTWHRPC